MLQPISGRAPRCRVAGGTVSLSGLVRGWRVWLHALQLIGGKRDRRPSFAEGSQFLATVTTMPKRRGAAVPLARRFSSFV